MSQFLQRAASEISGRRLLAPGQKILVAVSGGVDSMALLHVLSLLGAKNHWRICVAHFNHQLRGKASDGDETFVRQAAAKLGLKFFAGRGDVKDFAARSKLSVEMAARKLRHEFLAVTARKQKISTIALAHHADDQVELFFLRLLRGAGGTGLAGMKWCAPSPADKGISLVRPLLDFPKAEILAFARENQIWFRADASNFSNDFLRNRLRNELLPLLRQDYQPGLTGTVLRLMTIAGAEAEFVGEVATEWLKGKSGKRKAESGNVVAREFEKLPVAVQRKVLQIQLMAAGVAADFELVEQLRVGRDTPVSAGSSFAVTRMADGEIELFRESLLEFDLAERKVTLGRAGQVSFDGATFQWELKKGGARRPSKKASGQELFDADKVGGKIILRHWRAGDRFQPIGLKSAVKLQDLFVNAKIPAARRRELVLGTTMADEIFWVEGLRIGEPFKLTAETKRWLMWWWEK